MNRSKAILGASTLAAVTIAVAIAYYSEESTGAIRIGVVTDLTGDAAYWGESTREGAELAAEDLKKDNIGIQLVFEDYRLDAKQAAVAAQKLIAADKIHAIYADFNPAAVAIGSIIRDKGILFLYDAAVVSALEGNPYAFKTYLDYKTGCRAIAEKFKNQGFDRIGVLHITIEAGVLCAEGAKDVYHENLVVEKFNPGDSDFRSQITKLKAKDIKAIIVTAFEGDIVNLFKAKRELNYTVRVGTADDPLTDKVKSTFPDDIKGTITFGFPEIETELRERLLKTAPGGRLGSDYAAALAYVHVQQLARALSACKLDEACAREALKSSAPDARIGFQKFDSQRIANFDIRLKTY